MGSTLVLYGGIVVYHRIPRIYLGSADLNAILLAPSLEATVQVSPEHNGYQAKNGAEQLGTKIKL